VGVQIKMLNEKIAVEASRGARWRPPFLIFHRVVLFSAMFNFSTQAPVVLQPLSVSPAQCVYTSNQLREPSALLSCSTLQGLNTHVLS
jgi:hypothetical protein